MISAEEYTRLKRELDEQTKQTERKRGELARIEADLKKECGGEEPKALLHKLEKEVRRKEKKAEELLRKFKQQHPGIID